MLCHRNSVFFNGFDVFFIDKYVFPLFWVAFVENTCVSMVLGVFAWKICVFSMVWHGFSSKMFVCQLFWMVFHGKCVFNGFARFFVENACFYTVLRLL